MNKTQHPRAFFISVLWTLGLLYLGSVVHATESSLACPDWPTCFGTMIPEMTGGVFWEHLHRLVAGGLILFFGGALYLTFKETPRFTWVRGWTLAGMGFLLVQAALGGITVLFRLPDAVSTSHLGLAFLFLALVTILFTVTSRGWEHGGVAGEEPARAIRVAASTAAVLTFLQSVVGAAVRHTDAGMACPDVPLCLGQWIPPFQHGLVVLHFGHRLLGIGLLCAVLWAGHLAFRRGGGLRMRTLGVATALAALIQVLLGFVSVYTRLSVVPVSLHTLLAATLLTLLSAMATLTWAPPPEPTLGTPPAGGAKSEAATAGRGS